MKNISAYLTNFDAPSAGFSEGKLKDDPGDASGSGITVLTHNDFLYGHVAAIIKYLGALSGTDESETASDVLDAIETMSGIKNPNTADYDNSTTYAQDDLVMYLGVQFSSMINSNLGNNPLDNPDKWLPCFNRDDAVVKWRNGEDIKGGMEAVHDFRDAGYRQNFTWGKYNFGGNTGRNFDAFGVHLDGTVVTANPTLEAIFDVGGPDEYHLLDIIAPDVVGTRTLLDARGRVPRIVDAGGGDTENVGVVQGHAIENIIGKLTDRKIGNGGKLTEFATGAFAIGADVSTFSTVLSDATVLTRSEIDFDTSLVVDTDPDETRMKNYSVGVPSLLVLQEI